MEAHKEIHQSPKKVKKAQEVLYHDDFKKADNAAKKEQNETENKNEKHQDNM